MMIDGKSVTFASYTSLKEKKSSLHFKDILKTYGVQTAMPSGKGKRSTD